MLPDPPLSFRFDDIDLPSAVKYLIASDPNLQVLGAAYIQHKCYSDSNAKKQVRGSEDGAVPQGMQAKYPLDQGSSLAVLFMGIHTGGRY